MLSRRGFLTFFGLGAAMPALLAGPASARKHMGEGLPPPWHATNLDPTDPSDFVTPLLRPSRGGGVLGIFHPIRPFTISAQPALGAAEIIPGTRTDFLVYGVQSVRGSVVNPVLSVAKGQRIRATLQNNIDERTIIHWHGLIVDGHNDGGPLSAGLDAVPPGGSFAYDYEVLNRSGTYWYHPHPFLLTAEQAYKGLASFYIVNDEDESRLTQLLDLTLGETDIPVLIQDKRFDEDGQLVYEPNPDEQFMGFLGDTILANVTAKPYLDLATRIYRFRFLNGSTARIYKLAFVKGDTNYPFSIIGTDGGLLAAPITATKVFLAPGERVDVLLDLRRAAKGDELFLKSFPFDPMDNEKGGDGGMEPGREPIEGMADVPPNGSELYIMKLRVATKHHYWRTIPERLSTVTPIDLSHATERAIFLSIASEMNAQGMTMMKWVINGANYNDNPTYFPFEVDRNSVEIWEITNDMMSMPHPMHIHGYQFQVLERMWMGDAGMSPWEGLLGEDGLLATDKGWKDTVLLWPGETVRIAIDFFHPFPGQQDYVLHCHNLEHEEVGMMINYRVK